MNPYALAAAGLAVLGIVFGSFQVGRKYERAGFIEADLRRADKVIVRREVEIREIPKIVTKVVTKEVQVEKEVERVVTVIQREIPVDCLLPDRFGELLVAAANGRDPSAPGGADDGAGAYGCREVLEATLTDLKAGWKNSARLGGLQGWAQLVTRKESP